MDREKIINKQIEIKKEWPKSFETEKGSIYTYDDQGRTTRFKTVTGKQSVKKDITVFVDLNKEQESKILSAYHHFNQEDENKRIFVLERQMDDSAKIIRKREDVKYPEKLYLGIVENGVSIFNKKATLTPTIGYQVFDTRCYEKNGLWKTERHLGHKVTKINY